MITKSKWRKIEKASVYISLGAGLASAIAFSLSSIVPLYVPLSLVGVALLGGLNYLMRAVEEIRSLAIGELISKSFPEAFQDWISPYDEINEMIIAAFTSAYYYTFIQATNVRIRELRLLLFYQDNLQSTCADIEFDPDQTIIRWRNLQAKGHIGKLEIKRIPMQSSVYFSVVASQRALLGLLWPHPDLRDLKAESTFVMSRETSPVFVQDLVLWFESMWKCGTSLY